jgi:hypothetical protein
MPIGARPLDGYTIKRGIGAGGFGEVYYAKSDGGKDVAIKRIQRNLDIELRGVRQCLNIKHPHLVSLYDIKYDNEGQAWVVMEYVASENLQAVIDRNPNGMPIDAVRRWIDGIAAGTAHLHDCGIVHRDLKPANIFLDESTVKIGDYGLSKFISCSRRSGQTQSVGTFHYMAPEIGNGRYGKEIDIYALGIMLYEMLTGVVPFDGESSQEIIMKHLTAKPNLDRVPAEFRGVIAKSLAKDPKDRYRNVAEMQKSLGSAGHAPGTATATAGSNAPIGTASLPDATAADPFATGFRSAAVLPNEPIARAAVAASRELAKGWNDANLGVVPKLFLLVGGLMLLVFNVAWLIPYMGIVALSYGVYLGLRSVLYSGRGHRRKTITPQMQERHSVVNQARKRRMARKRVRLLPVHMRQKLAEKDTLAKSTELLGSLLRAAAAAGVFSLAMALTVEQNGGPNSWVPNFVWLAISSTLGAWAVLTAGKFWEAEAGDSTGRRFTMALCGMAVGCISYGLANGLLFQPAYILPDIQVLDIDELSPTLHDPYGMPRLAGFVVFFGILFGALRWWRQSDPTRRFRLSMVATALSVLAAIALQAVCPLPQAFLIAAATTIAVQISSPWMTRQERNELREELIAQEVGDEHAPDILA